MFCGSGEIMQLISVTFFFYSLRRLLWVLVRIKTSSKWFYLIICLLLIREGLTFSDPEETFFVYFGMAVSN